MAREIFFLLFCLWKPPPPLTKFKSLFLPTINTIYTSGEWKWWKKNWFCHWKNINFLFCPKLNKNFFSVSFTNSLTGSCDPFVKLDYIPLLIWMMMMIVLYCSVSTIKSSEFSSIILRSLWTFGVFFFGFWFKKKMFQNRCDYDNDNELLKISLRMRLFYIFLLNNNNNDDDDNRIWIVEVVVNEKKKSDANLATCAVFVRIFIETKSDLNFYFFWFQPYSYGTNFRFFLNKKKYPVSRFFFWKEIFFFIYSTTYLLFINYFMIKP